MSIFFSLKKKKEVCKGSKQKCEKPVDTFHSLSVVLATIIPVVCVIIIVSSIIFYLWRRHKKEEALEEKFDNKVEEDLDELYYKEEEDIEDGVLATGAMNDNVPEGSPSDPSTAAAVVTRRNNKNSTPKNGRFLSFKKSTSDRQPVSYKEKGRLAIMRQRMRELENQSGFEGFSNNLSNQSLSGLGTNHDNHSGEDLSFIQPPGLRHMNSSSSIISSNSKKSNLILTNDSLTIPMIPPSPSNRPHLSAANSSNTLKHAGSALNLDDEASTSRNDKVDSILLNSNRLEDVSEQDMREYMRHYDKIMGISGVDNMAGSFPGGRVPNGVLQQGKFFSKNPYNKNNNNSTTLKSYLNRPKNTASSLKLPETTNSVAENSTKPLEHEKETTQSVASNDVNEVYETPKESTQFSSQSSTKHNIDSESAYILDKGSEGQFKREKNSSVLTGSDSAKVEPTSGTISPELMIDQNPFLNEAEKKESRDSLNRVQSVNDESLDYLLHNQLNKNLISNINNDTDSGVLHQVEKFAVAEVNEAFKDIEETENKDDIILSPEQEESLRRLKSVYKIYMDTNVDEDAMLEKEEQEDKVGDISGVQKSNPKGKRHTSSIYSEFPSHKGYDALPSESHALPTYDINAYKDVNTAVQVENSLPNPELYADYYELDPESEQYYYYDPPSEIHYYFDPISQQYYYYDQKVEQYFCNIDGQVYFYDSINHIPYYYDEEQGGYFYLGQPDLDHTQFQQPQLMQPNSYRNTHLEQHILETEEDHMEIMENMKTLVNPSNLDSSTNYSLTNFARSNNRKITPHKQLQNKMSQAFAFDPLDNRETSYNSPQSYTNHNQYRSTSNNDHKSAAYKLSRESVAMTDPLQFSGAKTKFRPAGSIRNLNSYITNNNNVNL